MESHYLWTEWPPPSDSTSSYFARAAVCKTTCSYALEAIPRLSEWGSLFQNLYRSKMVFTNAQITSFFQDRDQMGLSNRTTVYLQGEVITDPNDLLLDYSVKRLELLEL